jgi:hypothetical protein
VTTDAKQPAPPAPAHGHLENTDTAERGYLSRTQALHGHRDTDRSYSTGPSAQTRWDANS